MNRAFEKVFYAKVSEEADVLNQEFYDEQLGVEARSDRKSVV